MDIRDQLKQLFPDHVPEEDSSPIATKEQHGLWIQDEPILCKYEKRRGKPHTILEGYNGTEKDLKSMARMIKRKLNVGGSVKDEVIVIQGNYRDGIMEMLKDWGFKVKRVGG